MTKTEKATEALVKAILDESPEGVRQALQDGANVNAHFGVGLDPIWMQYSRFLHNKTDRATNQIWELIIPHARGFMEPTASLCEEFPRFQFVFSMRNVEVLSLMALGAIRETNGSARIDLPAIFSGLGFEPTSPVREECRDRILAVHERVRERLRNPSTPFEKEAAASLLTAEDRDYWKTPLDFPDLAHLPTAGQVSPRLPFRDVRHCHRPFFGPRTVFGRRGPRFGGGGIRHHRR